MLSGIGCAARVRGVVCMQGICHSCLVFPGQMDSAQVGRAMGEVGNGQNVLPWTLGVPPCRGSPSPVVVAALGGRGELD